MRQFIKESKASISKVDLMLLFDLLGGFRPSKVLEIGTWKGYSAVTWGKAFDPEEITTIGNDKSVGNAEIADEWDQGGVECLFIHINKDSHDPEVANSIKDHSYGFIFIDGDHSYEGVKKDWELYKDKITPGGVFVFHDVVYTAPDPEVNVKRLWEEIRDDYHWVEIRSKDSTGMGVLFT